MSKYLLNFVIEVRFRRFDLLTQKTHSLNKGCIAITKTDPYFII